MHGKPAYKNIVNSYQDIQKSTMTGRELEASVLTKGALLLKNCQNDWEKKDMPKELGRALKYNQSVWTIFQGELIKEDHLMPGKLRQDILSLSLFIDKRIFEIMANPEPDKLNAIININLGLAAGLRNSS